MGPGDEIAFERVEAGVVVRRARRRPALRGRFAGSGMAARLLEDRRAEPRWFGADLPRLMGRPRLARRRGAGGLDRRRNDRGRPAISYRAGELPCEAIDLRRHTRVLARRLRSLG